MATNVSFVALSESFFDRLDTFSIARLLKITLVLLFFDENHYLTSLRASLGRELAQRRFSFCPKRSNSDAKKRSALGQRADAGLRHTKARRGGR